MISVGAALLIFASGFVSCLAMVILREGGDAEW